MLLRRTCAADAGRLWAQATDGCPCYGLWSMCNILQQPDGGLQVLCKSRLYVQMSHHLSSLPSPQDCLGSPRTAGPKACVYCAVLPGMLCKQCCLCVGFRKCPV
jgi:hypothetical protein